MIARHPPLTKIRVGETEVAKILLARAAKADVHNLGQTFIFVVLVKQAKFVELILNALLQPLKYCTKWIGVIVESLYWAVEDNQKKVQELSAAILGIHPATNAVDTMLHEKSTGSQSFLLTMQQLLELLCT
jgi:hypothetical protein